MKSSFWTDFPMVFNFPAKKIIALCFFAITLVVAQTAQAAYFVDNAASGCSNGGKTYNPASRSCSGGSDTVYTSLNNANSAISAGSAAAPTVVNIRSGNYYERITVTKDYTTWRKYPSDSSNPVIDGQWVRPSADSALIYGANVTGVTIDGITFQNAGYQGSGGTQYAGANAIRFDSPNSITIQNCSMLNIGSAAVMLIFNGINNIVQDNYMEYCNLEIYQGYWAAAINIHCGTDYNRVSRNTIYRCYGEGIQLTTNKYYGSSDHNIVEYNTIIDNPRVAIYVVGSAYQTIRYNLIYHTHSSGSPQGGAFGNLGIMFSCENDSYYDSHHNEVYGNMVVGMSVALFFGYDSRSPNFKVRDSKFYNNTLIESVRDPGDWGSVPTLISFQGGDTIGSNVSIRNNILWQTTGTLNDDSGYGATYQNNLYNKKPSGVVQASTDPTYPSYPTLNIADYLQNTSGWVKLGAITLTGKEFSLRSTATYAKNAGGNLDSTYDTKAIDLDASDFTSGVFALVEQTSIGADVYAQSTVVLSPPSAPRIEGVQN